MSDLTHIPLRRRLAGPCHDGSRPGPTIPPMELGRGAFERPAIWTRLKALNDRVEHSWVGDCLGVAALFAGLIIGLFFVGVYQ